MKKKFISVITVMALIMSSSITVFAEPNITELEEKVQVLDNEIITSLDKVETLKTKIDETDKTIKSREESIVRTEKDIEEQQNVASGRIRTFYKSGFYDSNSYYLSVILEGDSVGDIINKVNAVRIISEVDKEVEEELKNKIEELRIQSEKLKKDEESLKTNKVKVEEELKSLEDKKKEVEELLKIAKETPPQPVAFRVSRGGFNNVTLSNEVSPQAKVVIDEALKYIGTPYVWGGANPSGFDCSGYMQYVYRAVGVELPRVSQSQQLYGQSIPVNEIKPGDMVFWGYPAHHVGMYIGDGQYIHAPTTGDTVKISSLSYSPITSATRVQ